MSKNKKDEIRYRSYLAKDFSGFKSDLTRYARTYFPDRISDFSDNSLGGMFIELAAYIGDNMSYYMDHQFKELSLEDAVEPKNVERLIRNSGVEIVGAAPSYVPVDFYIEAPARESAGTYSPDADLMPIIKQGTVVSSGAGVNFTLMEDIDFSERDVNGKLRCKYVTMKSDDSGNPTTFSVSKGGICTSSTVTSETFSISNKFIPFRTISLSKASVVEVISVVDAEGNNYYQVENLAQDTVYRSELNSDYDRDSVSEVLSLRNADRRFVVSTDINSRKSSLRFGGGSPLGRDDDIMPDPSELSVPFYGKGPLRKFTIDPNRLLNTTTLGISPINTSITVVYRYGGGLNHNVKASSIRTVTTLITKFKSSVSPATVSSIRASTEVINRKDAAGGENPPTIDELRSFATLYKNSQARIVTKEDLLARVYTMPSKFGRIFRASIRANPNNPQASILSIISRDSENKLVVSPDNLKNNLALYLNESRLISDAIDIVDISVVNLTMAYSVLTSDTSNADTVIQAINVRLAEYFRIENFQVGTPVIISDIVNLIINTSDVISLINISFNTISGVYESREYSEYSVSIDDMLIRGVITPPAGSIFELRYRDDDIIGQAG